MRDNDNGHRIARLCLAIPLAPPGRVQEALNCIVIEARRLGLMDEFAEFFQYIQQTWINYVGDAILSVFGIRHRTNNVAECFHRNINARLVRRPNVWRFVGKHCTCFVCFIQLWHFLLVALFCAFRDNA